MRTISMKKHLATFIAMAVMPLFPFVSCEKADPDNPETENQENADNGQQTEGNTDSGKILKDMRAGQAALLPLGGLGEATGGYKGYGFTAIVEILSAALAGGPYMKALNGKDENGKTQMYRLGHFFFVINPEFFMGLDTFKKTAGGICRDLRASAKAPGAERIYTAGEKEHLAWLDRKDKGVPVGEAIQKEFIALRDEFKLPYKFPFEK